MLKKEKFIFKKGDALILLLSFLIPVIIMELVFAHLGFYPFGDKSLLIMDLRGQYADFLASIRYIGDDNSMFLSWSRAMGGNYLGLAAYYIASPLSLLTLLFPVEQMPLAVNFIELLKIGLCGLTFSVFVMFCFNKKNNNWGIIPFACAYSLMSYNIVYGMCFMWLDGVIFLPLVLLGVEQILKGKKGFIYLASIAGLFISNYYTSYMVGIFAAMYFCVRLISTSKRHEIKKMIKKCLRFGINTVLAFGLSMPLVLPVVKDLMAGKLSASSYSPTDVVFNFSFFSFFTKLLPGKYDTIRNVGALPSVFCGVIICIFTLFFFFQKENNKRDRVGALFIGVVLILSFYIFKLDVFWHGMQYPNWFPHRYAFLFSFYMVLYGFRSYNNLEFENMFKYAIPAMMFFLVLSETFVNACGVISGLDNEFHYADINEFNDFMDTTKPLLDEINKTDDGFYRIEKDYEYSENDAMLLGYNGMTHYSSTYNLNVNNITRNLGMAQSYIWNSGYGSTIVTDSLFNIKYKMLRYEPVEAYSKIKEDENILGANVYKNNQCLSIGYAVDKGLVEYPMDLREDPFENQNQFLSALCGEYTNVFRDFYCEVNRESDCWKINFVAQSDNPVYIRMFGDSYNTSTPVYVNGNMVGEYFDSKTMCCLYLGTFSEGETVEVTTDFSGNITAAIISELYYDKWSEINSNLSKEQFNVKYHKNGKLKGDITVADDKMVFTSIPYDEGFKILVDGKKVNAEIFADTFIAFPVSKGKHNIVISYVSPGFLKGLYVAIIATALIVIYYNVDKIKRKLFTRREKNNG